MKLKFSILVLTLALFSACSSEIDHDYIRNRKWIAEEGFKIDDLKAMEFTGSYELKGDTVYSGGVAKAVVTALYKNDNILMVKSIPGGEEGKYLDAVEYVR
jgi:hypothetical protein